MPKKSKVVVCPRCRRTVLAEEYTVHLSTHKGKKVNSFVKKPKLPRFQEIPEMPGSAELYNAYASNKTILSNLSSDQIAEKFKKSLNDVEAQYSTLKCEQVKNALITEVTLDEKRNLILRYNPLSLRALTEQTIDGLLLHEACHVATLPHTNVLIPIMANKEMSHFIGNHTTSYDEYLAHTELIRRFRNDLRYEGLKEQQVGLFKNYDIIVGSIQSFPDKFGQNQFFMYEQLGTIVYDSLFFLVAKDDSFLNWAKKRNLEKLELFTQWIYEDFEKIKSLDLPFDETRRKVRCSAVLSMSVNPLAVFFNKIIFDDKAKETYEEWRKHNADLELVELWEQRRLAYQAK
jgi:hypothetical protein